MTDYKQLCVELLDSAEELDDLIEGIKLGNYMPDSFTLQPMRAVLERARAALAEPEPEEPTDEELLAALKEAIIAFPPNHPDAQGLSCVEYETQLELRKARVIFASWGSPAPRQIPVTERLPGPEDCIANPRNGQGQWCWGWCVDDSAVPFSGRWRMIRRQWLADEAVAWLPAHALPVPS